VSTDAQEGVKCVKIFLTKEAGHKRSMMKMKSIQKPSAYDVGPLTDLKQKSEEVKAWQDRTFHYYRRYLDTLEINRKSE